MRKKHPVLFSLFLIVVIVAVLCGVLVGLTYLSGAWTPVPFGDQVALLEVRGVLSDGKPITDALARFGDDQDVKAIILRIDSPGGGVAPAQEIFSELTRIRARKPVVAFLGNVAASGGYYVAAGATKIVASPGTLTGSIGAVFQVSNFQELLKKIGLDFSILKAGKYKDIGSPYRDMTDEERELLQKLLDDVHEQFIRDVARGRKLPEDKVREIADGRVMTGMQAKELGLVDDMGNFQDALDLAKALAGITGKVSIVEPSKRRPSLWEFLVDRFVDAVLERIQTYAPQIQALHGGTGARGRYGVSHA